jgi:TRAP transporter TAXI family solute receptor
MTSMNKPTRFAPALIPALALASFASFGSTSASAQTLVMATDRVGSILNATGAGLAKIATKHSKRRIVIRSFAGPDAFLDALNKGEHQFSALSATSAYFAYNGMGRYKSAFKNLRIVRSGFGAVRLTFAVPKKSNIHSVADLKGKRVAAHFGGHAVVVPMVGATLATGGLSWADVKKVPVTGVVDSVRALGDRRVDAAWASFGMPAAREVHAKMGIRYLPLGNDPKTLSILRKQVFPGIIMVPMKARPKMGLEKDAFLITYDTYLVGHKDVDGAAIKDILTALWDNQKELRKIHFGLRGFSNKTAISSLPIMPYHKAAVEFYKSKGVWNAKVDAQQKALK